MSAKHSYEVDRTGWTSGPWDNEPDYLQFKTKVGLPALVVRNAFGGLCGYVGVAREHSAYEVSYDDVELDNYYPHGGLTYSDHCQEHICHVPEPGEPDDIWWLGFDCVHSNDYAPGDRSAYLWKNSVYRDMAYVQNECEELAVALKAMEAK